MLPKIDLISRYYCNNVLPQIYGTSLSYPEQLCAVEKGINDVINRVNSFNEFIKEIYDLLKDLDEGIKNEVIRIITDMYESGELAEIIQSIVAKDLQGKNNTLDFSRIARTITLALPENATTFDTENYAFPQGSTTFKIGGVRYWVVAYLPHNGGHYEGIGQAQINVYQQISENYIKYLSSSVFGGVGHANGLCLNEITSNGFSILVTASEKNQKCDIIKLTFNTDTNTWDNETETKTVAYDNIEYIGNICKYNNAFYLLCNNNTVYEYDYYTNTINGVICVLNYNANNTNAGITVDNTYIYVADSVNNSIVKCLKTTGEIYQRYAIPLTSNGGMYLFGELESIMIENNIIYAVTGYTLQPKPVNNYIMVQFWKQSLTSNKFSPTNYINGAAYRNTFYVNGNVPTSKDDAINPTGLTWNDSFNCVQEAINYGKHNETVKSMRINTKQPVNRATIYIDTEKPIFLSGESYYDVNNTTPILGAIFGVNGQNLRIAKIGVNNRLPIDTPETYSSIKQNCIYVLNGSLNLIDCYFPTGEVSNPLTVLYAVTVNSGICNFNRSVFGTTEEQWMTRNGNKFINGNNATINGHGQITLDNNVIG